MNDCPDCGVAPGTVHIDGCDVERCPHCGRQMLSCGCTVADDQRMPWTGEWPGESECRERGFFCVLNPGGGWVRCQADYPGATPDLNRLLAESVWDREQRKWVPRLT